MAERIILSGPEKILRAVIPLTMATHTLIRNRDIGCWVGERLEALTRAAPQPLSLTVFFHNNRVPPFIRKKDVRHVRAECTIPILKPESADWHIIKAACGGVEGYTWGSWMITAKLCLPDGENIHWMKLYSGTKSGGKAQLESLASLSRCQILKMDASDQGIGGTKAQDKSIQKISTQVFPSYFCLFNQKKVQSDAKGYGSLAGIYSRADARINLWPPTEPPDAAEIIRDCLRMPSAQTNE
jgi:hypothetical protein